MSRKNLFITGSSGTVGKYLLSEFLRRNFRIYALLRPEHFQENLKNITSFLKARGLSTMISEQIVPLQGDVTIKNFGLSPKEFTNLTMTTSHIIHCAGDTRFSLPLLQARRINVEGTRRVVEFAKKCSHLQGLGYLSTIYVSGRRQGKVFENDLLNYGFVNSYEQSKFEAEHVIQQYRQVVPIVVYRLSTIIGDSQSGAVSRFTSVHKALKLYFTGLAPMVPGKPANIVDLISVDYAARVVSFLFTEKFKEGKTYHIKAEKKKSFTLEQIMEETERLFKKLSPAWRAKNIARPPIVSYDVFELFESSAREAEDAVLMEIIKIMHYFVPHLSYETEFDTTNTHRDLPHDIVQPAIEDYYEKIIRYCIDSKWGKISYAEGSI